MTLQIKPKFKTRKVMEVSAKEKADFAEELMQLIERTRELKRYAERLSLDKYSQAFVEILRRFIVCRLTDVKFDLRIAIDIFQDIAIVGLIEPNDDSITALKE